MPPRSAASFSIHFAVRAATMARWDSSRRRRCRLRLGATREGPLALPLDKAGLDSGQVTGTVAVAAVDDATLGVEQDGLVKPVLMDVGGELL